MTPMETRVVRRELHSSRAGAAIPVAVVVALALAYLATECIVAAAGGTPLLLAPSAMVEAVAGVADAAQGVVVAAAVASVLAGLVLLVLAVSPGRRGRHVLEGDGPATIVDDEVIASALVRAAADRTGVDPDRAVATVGRRSATLRITPEAGSSVDRDAVRDVATERLEHFGLKPAIRPRVTVAERAEVGS